MGSETSRDGSAKIELSAVRAKATEWNAISSKKVPYEFIEYVEGKREPSTDYNCCEWNCVGAASEEMLFETSCGRTFNILNSPKVLQKFKYCPNCGKRAVMKGV